MTDFPEPGPARLLGFAGLIPFVAGALVMWLGGGELAGFAERALVAYGAVILSFMGAVHWGLAMHSAHPRRNRQLGLSVLPALVAWVALLLPPVVAFPVLLVCFAGLNAADRQAVVAAAAPAWYPSLRLPLTIAVVVCLGLAWLRVVLV